MNDLAAKQFKWYLFFVFLGMIMFLGTGSGYWAIIGAIIFGCIGYWVYSWGDTDRVSTTKNMGSKTDNYYASNDTQKNTNSIEIQTPQKMAPSSLPVMSSAKDKLTSAPVQFSPHQQQSSAIQKNVVPFSEPTEILCALIKKQGISVFNNSPTFNGLLKDYYKGEYKAEFTILTKSIEENIPQDLLSRKDKIPLSVLSGQLAQKLENCGFSHELSAWAVNAWIKALGL